ncbi:heavy metal-associated isoprenylated plant protein 8-like [Quercus robur]|uniref:heavy metal-associated isoprenylated plant protein 8-like n=1 Tax=Quercus robur TaxID=38942 RepID=UPI0021610D14|nr:heavy metal-associated isoprenylated plant protein 8-like [Quercus robur]
MGKGKNKQLVEKEEMKSEEKKEEKNTGNSNKEIVLKVFMHCEGCCQKFSRCLKRLDGVEDVVIDSANRKVVVKGKNADPLKALQTLQKKYSRNVQVKVVVLKMYMHCEGCANDIKKCIERIKETLNVETNKETSRVIVKGAFDPLKLVESIKKRQRKHVEIVKQEQGEKVGSQGKGNDNKKGTEQYKDNSY